MIDQQDPADSPPPRSTGAVPQRGAATGGEGPPPAAGPFTPQQAPQPRSPWAPPDSADPLAPHAAPAADPFGTAGVTADWPPRGERWRSPSSPPPWTAGTDTGGTPGGAPPGGAPHYAADRYGGAPPAAGAYAAGPPRAPRLPAPPDPADQANRRGTLPVAVVGLLAGLIGALIGGGLVVALDTDPAPADGVTPVVQQRSPTVELEGGPGVDRVAAVAEAVIPTVVQIDLDSSSGFSAGNGSGVVYRSDGYIVTSNHVIAGGGALNVVFSDGTRAEARVVGTDEQSDLAVLQVDRADLTAIQIGDSSALRVGELAVAVGSPFGLDGSVTAGVISALNRPISVPGSGDGALRLPSVIQTDAPINPGNSGGALVSGEGRLIGINSAILTSGQPANAGVGFAIPSNTVVDIVEELIATGQVRYPFLGVQGSTLTPDTSARLGIDAGAFIELVQPGTPAEDAGLQAGDVVVAVEGEPIDSMDALIIAIRDGEVGDTVRVTYIREGDRRDADVTLTEFPTD